MSTEQSFKVATKKRAYVVKVKVVPGRRAQRPFSYGFDFGGRKLGCVAVTVNVPDPELAASDPRFAELEARKSTAFVSWIGYDARCSLDADLPGGEGTRHMVRTALTFVKRTCPWVDAFSLSDAVTVTCAEGQRVDLASLSWAEHGKTYYERYFGATISDPGLAAMYAGDTARMSDPEAKPHSYEAWARSVAVPAALDGVVRRPYETSATYVDFFRALKKSSGTAYCRSVHPWIDAFVRTVLTREYWSTTWRFDAAKVAPVEFDVTPAGVVAGGTSLGTAPLKRPAGPRRRRSPCWGRRASLSGPCRSSRRRCPAAGP